MRYIKRSILNSKHNATVSFIEVSWPLHSQAEKPSSANELYLQSLIFSFFLILFCLRQDLTKYLPFAQSLLYSEGLPLNVDWSSCLRLLNVGKTHMGHHTQFICKSYIISNTICPLETCKFHIKKESRLAMDKPTLLVSANSW